MNFLAVDPGLRHSGVALFQDSTLYACALVKNPVVRGDDAGAIRGMAHAVEAWASGFGVGFFDVAVEQMQSYDPSKQKGDQNDLITLSLIAGMLRPTFLYLPRMWKGQLPKPERKSDPYIVEARVRARLTPAELARIPDNTGPAWDVIDAIGIGLYHCGRFERKRGYAR